MKTVKPFRTLKELNRQIPQRLIAEGKISMTRPEIGYYFNNLLGSEVPKSRPIHAFGYEIVETQPSMI